MKPISVIVTFFDRPGFLMKTLTALVPQLGEGDECIVVNDGGEHPELPEGVKYVWQEKEGYRLSTARNKGITQARNPYIITLDDGIVPDSGFMEAYRSRVKPRTLLLGGLRFEYDPVETRYWSPEMSRTYEYPDHMRGFGGQQCFNREDAVAIGGFDERFNGCWGFEDSAFLKAMACSGVTLEKCFEAMATHLYHPPTFTDECKDRNRVLFNEFVKEYEKGVYPRVETLKPQIIVEDTKLKDENQILSHVIVFDDLKKYFRSPRFYAYYDVTIKADTSILNIPVISSLLTLAWLAGADVYVERLDKTFVESMENYKKEFMKMYPHISFDTDFVVGTLVENKTHSKDVALFFSGGLDSTYSLFNNIKLPPRLITVGGFDVYMSSNRGRKVWAEWKDVYSAFAVQEGLTLDFIYTNSREMIDEDSVQKDFPTCFGGISYWNALRHPLTLLGLGAPLSVGRFNRLLVAASRTPDDPPDKTPFASHPQTDEKVAWADLSIKHDGYVHRYQKAFALEKPLKEGRIRLRSCYKLVEGLNCSNCEKCYKIILFLTFMGVDPNHCGFSVDEETLRRIRRFIEEGSLQRRYRLLSMLHWAPFQRAVQGKQGADIYGSKEFFEWFRTVRL